MHRANDAGTVDRVVALLTVIAESEGLLAIQSLADQLTLPRSTVHRLLEKLTAHDLVTHDRALRRYRIGPELYRLGSLVSRQPLATMAMPVLRELAASVGEVCVLGVLLPNNRRMTFATKVDTDQPLRYRIELDKPITLAQGASGWSILAYMPPDDIAAVIVETFQGKGSRAWQAQQSKQLREKLERVRANGYAHSRGSRIPGAVGLAAPVFSVGSQVFGSICITIPEQRYEARAHKSLVTRLMQATTQLSTLLGDRQAAKAR